MYYENGMGLGLGRLGQAADAVTQNSATQMTVSPRQGWAQMTPLRKGMAVASLAATPALAYHGYRRNDSVGWALVWGIFGSMVWPITVPIAFAQGFGKPKVAKNRRRRAPVRRKRRTSRRRRRTSRRR